MTRALLEVRNLSLFFDGAGSPPILEGLDLELSAGEALALVGPSGCGKSLTARALCGLLPPTAGWRGEIRWDGERLTDPDGPRWSALRGPGMTLILQEPLAALNPVMTVGAQITETLRCRQGLSGSRAERQARILLDEVRLPRATAVMGDYPHQLSGGMRQRVLLAAALACDPELLIADEPTSNLDLAVQREILALLDRIRRERGVALLFITHDLALVPHMAERAVVLAEGQPPSVMLSRQLSSIPVLTPVAAPGREGKPVLSVKNLRVEYDESGRGRPAVDGVDLDLWPGEIVGLAGESGCGKTSLARALVGRLDRVQGEILLRGQDLRRLSGGDLRAARRRIQMAYQDAGASLNPRHRVETILGEAGCVDVAAGLAEVGLSSQVKTRFPHQLSGGQRQRVGLARNLAASPAVLIADEITSSLDQRRREQILQLLVQAGRQNGLALLLISHDLDLLQQVCSRIMVMDRGILVEDYPTDGSSPPRHACTLALRAALPPGVGNPQADWLAGKHPSRNFGTEVGPGCTWQIDCPVRKSICSKALPPLREVAPRHVLRCPE